MRTRQQNRTLLKTDSKTSMWSSNRPFLKSTNAEILIRNNAKWRIKRSCLFSSHFTLFLRQRRRGHHTFRKGLARKLFFPLLHESLVVFFRRKQSWNLLTQIDHEEDNWIFKKEIEEKNEDRRIQICTCSSTDKGKELWTKFQDVMACQTSGCFRRASGSARSDKAFSPSPPAARKTACHKGFSARSDGRR